jgi:hypothetical protein
MIMKRVPTAAQLLGFAGLLPFFGLTLAIWVVVANVTDEATVEQVTVARQWAGFLLYAQLLYAGIIATFLGAVHWGLGMANMGWESQRTPVGPRINDGGEGTPRMEGPTRQLLWSVVPSLIAWAVILAFQFLQTGRLALVVMMILFFACYRADRNAARFQLGPEWYVELRKVLTIAVLIALAGSFAAMM